MPEYNGYGSWLALGHHNSKGNPATAGKAIGVPAYSERYAGHGATKQQTGDLMMRQRRYCELHGVEWFSGDSPCRECAEELKLQNKMITELSTKKTNT